MYLLYFVKFQNVWARDSKTNAKLTKLLHLENCMRDQVDTRSCFNISATLYRDRIDVETMSCNYKESWKTYITRVKINWITKHRMLPQQKLVMCTQLIHKYWICFSCWRKTAQLQWRQQYSSTFLYPLLSYEKNIFEYVFFSS